MPKLNLQQHRFLDDRGPDDAPGDYYVSCTDAGNYALLAGPFRDDHAAALAMLPRARELACERDPKAHFYGFGTCRREPDPTRPVRGGILNAALDLPEEGV